VQRDTSAKTTPHTAGCRTMPAGGVSIVSWFGNMTGLARRNHSGSIPNQNSPSYYELRIIPGGVGERAWGMGIISADAE